MDIKQEPIPVKIVQETPKLTLGKSWQLAILSLSFGLFFFWLPPIAGLLLIISAVFFPVSIIWSIVNLISKFVGKKGSV